MQLSAPLAKTPIIPLNYQRFGGAVCGKSALCGKVRNSPNSCDFSEYHQKSGKFIYFSEITNILRFTENDSNGARRRTRVPVARASRLRVHLFKEN